MNKIQDEIETDNFKYIKKSETKKRKIVVKEDYMNKHGVF